MGTANQGKQTKPGWLTGQMLVAMPSMQDPRFARTVIYICTHGPEGAMGLVLNRLYGELNFRGLLSQFNIMLSLDAPDLPIHFGGPVEPARGFVLHTMDFRRDTTMPIDGTIGLTASLEILQAMADGVGPAQALLALGYAGWGTGQLDGEMRRHGWYAAQGSAGLIFDTVPEARWAAAWRAEGIDPAVLAPTTGTA